MNAKITKAELQTELQAAQKRIAELERAAEKKTAAHPHSKMGEQVGETLFTQIFQTNPCLMALTDLTTGEYVEVNEAFLQTLGFTQAEVIDKTSLDLKLFVDPDQWAALSERMKDQRYLVGEHVLLRSKTGEIRHGVLAGKYIQWQERNLLLTVMNDVTESKQAEEQIQQSEAYYRALIANANDLIIVIDSQGKITFASPASEHIIGYTPEELIGQDFRETVHPKDLPEVNRSFARRSQTPGTAAAPRKARILHKDGNWRLVEALGTNMFDTPVVRGLILNVHDITEQEQVNTALREGEEKYRSLIDSQEASILMLDAEGAIYFINEIGAAGLGGTVEEITGRKLQSFLSPEDEEHFMAPIHATFQTNSGVTVELKAAFGATRPGWRRVNIQPIHDANGEVYRVMVNSLDITERKQAEEAQQASEANYRNLVENSESAIAVVDRDGKVLFANAHGIEVWQDPDIVGKDIYEIYPPEYADRYKRAIQTVIDTRNSILDEAESPIAGRLMWFRLSMTPLKNPDGTVTSLLLNAWDITERKQAEEALKRSERVLRLFVEHSPAAIAMFDREMRYIAVSRRYLQDYGLGNEDLTGRSHYEVFPEINEHIRQVHQRCLKGATERADEDPFLRANGNLDWVHWEVRPWYEEVGKIGGIILFSEVITERKVAQERLRESEERYHQFVSQSFEGILRTEFDQPVNVLLPVEEQIDQIYENAYLAESNQAMADMYNLPVDGLLGMRLIDAHGGRNNPVHRESLRKLIATGYRSINNETIKYTVDGRPLWLLSNMVGTVKDGKLIRLWETAIAITDRKRAEQSLLESEEKYRTLINSMSDGVFVAQDEKFVFCNAYLPAMLGYAPEEFENVPFTEVLAPEHLSLWTKRFHQRISGEDIVSNYQVQFVDKSKKKKIWIELRASRITYGRQPAVLGIVRDVTDQRQILEQIESLAKFPAENPGPVLRIDLNGKLLYANETSFAQLTEWTLEVGKPAPTVLINAASLVLESGLDKTIETVHHNRVVTLDFVLLGHGSYINIYGRDITEQRRAEEELRLANERFNELAENVSDVFWIAEPGTRRHLYISPVYAKVMGISVEDMVNLPNGFLDILLPEDRPIVEHEREMEDSGFKTDVKYRIRRPDGSFRWIHDKGTPVFDETGKVVRVVGIASDITEQVEVERRVNESEVRFRQIAETIPEVFWIFDTTQQQLLYISPAYETIFGQSAQELYADSRLYIKSIHPEDRSIMFAALRRQAHGEEIEIRYRIIRPDGLMRWIHFRSFPIFDETTGKLARTAGIAADITENKLADQALRDSEERLRLSLAASRQGLYDLNIQSGETIVNHEYVEMLGYAPETFVETHQKWIERLHPEDKQAVAKTYSNYIQGIAPEFHVEFRQKTKDGKWKWILSIGKVVEYDANGNPLRLLGTHTDIDALKQAEMELQKRASQLTLINDMAGEITGVLDIQGVLELSARLVHASFGYHHVGLFTMNEAKNEMVMRSRAGKYAHLFPSQHRVKLGEGIVGNVGRRGEMILTNQVGENPVYKNYFPALLDTVSELGLPIKIAGQVIGVLDVQSPQPNAFNSDDIQVLQTLADQVAIALENARLYESVQKELIERKQAEKERQVLIHDLGERVKELTALHQAARLFQNLNLSEKEIMQSLVEILPQAWQYPKFTVARISVGREEYTTRGFIETQWLQKASFTLPDDRTGAIEVVYLKECPLEDEGPFLKEERALIDTLAERLQSSMARQFMEHSLRKRTEDLANLVEAGRTLSESLDPQRIYPLVYRYIANVVPCDFITVSSHDPSTGRIKYEYWHTTEGAQDISDMFFEPLENSIQSRVIRNGESLLLPDYESALKTAANNMNLDEMVEEESEGRARSAIIVPLKVNGVTAGVLQVSSLKLNTHTQDHLRFIEALAFHVSAALSNALLFSELEERVRQRTAEVQDLYDNAPTGYHSLDEEGRYIAVNQTEMSWLGYTREELIGHPFMEFATPENRQMFSNNFALFKKRGWVSDLELDLIRQDGSTFPVLINATVVRDEAGNYLSSRSTMFDNTERKKAEITLRESEEQSRLLFEESPEAVVLFDQAGRVVRMNRAFETVTGLKSEEFIGHLVTEIGILPRDLMDALASQTADEVEAGDRFARLEFKLKHANSEPRDISARIFVVNLHGRLHYLASMHDITIRKRAEETLRLANAEMERALRLKDEFLANMSHELRTPLNAILGITESLLEQVSGALNDKQQKYLQTVLESAQHLLELINDILDLAKINAGRIGLDVSKVNIQSIAQSSLRMIRELAQKKGLDVKLEIDQAVKTVWADERRLRQMLVNLLSNAVKFTPTGGKIGLDIRADQSGEILTFTVWDSGIGINENDMRLLFQPFVQLDAGLARGSQGTGLGLVLVSQMARLHGGSVSVESEPEKGSRFIIAIPWKEAIQTAPLAESRLPEATVEPSAVVQNDRASILIVEDTEAVIMLVSDYLKLHGFHVITAKDGYEGLTRAEETHPDLILMDVMMPEMDGLETTRRIRNQLGMKDVPIIALTALAMAGDRERCLAAGMSDYLSKPVKLKELLTAIEKNLDSTKGGSQ